MGFGVLCEVEGEVVKCGEQVGTGGGGGFGIPVVVVVLEGRDDWVVFDQGCLTRFYLIRVWAGCSLGLGREWAG